MKTEGLLAVNRGLKTQKCKKRCRKCCRANLETEAVRELFKGGVDVFKDYLDRKRQKKSEDADPPGSKPEKKGLLERLRGKNKPAGEAAP